MLGLVRARLRQRGGLFFGWWVVLAGGVMMALNGGLLFHSFGAYFVRLQGEFGWSRALLSGSFSMMQLEGGIIGPMQGWLIDRLGPKVITQVGLLVTALGFVLFSMVDSARAFYVAFAIIGLGFTLAGWVTMNVAVANWFRRWRGTAMGLVGTGQAVGGLLVPAVAWSLTTFGWRNTALGSAALFLLVGLPIAQALRRTPEEYGMTVDGAPPLLREGEGDASPQAARRVQSEVEFTAGEAVRTPAFWLIGLGHAFALLVVSAVGVHLIPHLVNQRGVSVELAGSMLAFMTVLTLTGHVGGGFLGDHMEKRLLAAMGMVGHSLAMLVLAFTNSNWWVLVFAVLHGVAWGVRGPLMSAIRADYFGRRAFGTIMGFSTPIVMLGTIFGPMLVAVVADHTGTEQQGFVILSILTGLGTCFFLLARRPAPPQRSLPRRTV